MSSQDERSLNILLTVHADADRNNGAGGTMLRIAEATRSLGHQVTLVSTSDMLFRGHNITQRALMAPTVASRLQKIRKTRSIDVVDADVGDIWLWAILRRRPPFPVTLTRTHGPEHIAYIETRREAKRRQIPFSLKKLYLRGHRLWETTTSMKLADGIMSANRLERRFIINRFGIEPSKVHIVGEGLDPVFLSKAATESGPAVGSDGAFRIAWIGRFSRQKGADYAIPALKKLLFDHPSIHLSVFGAIIDPERKYEEFFSMFEDRIDHVNSYHNHDLPNLLQGQHLHLFPSLSEGFGKALSEGMACGLATVTTNPAKLAFIKHGVNALVVPKRNSAAIDSAIRQVLGNRDMLSVLGRNAQRTVAKMSWLDEAKRRVEIYHQYIAHQHATLRSGNHFHRTLNLRNNAHHSLR